MTNDMTRVQDQPSPPVAGTSVGTARVRVVVIENSPYDMQLIREALDLWTRPFDLTCFADGTSALADLHKCSASLGPAFLVLLDWNLSGLHGSKVLKQIRESPHRCFVVVFTSSSSEVDRDLSKALGADLFLTKALDLDDFFLSIVNLQNVV